jgi:hypothetical protein
MAMVYRETVEQAQLLAYTDDFWMLAVMFAAVPIVLPFMRRIRLDPQSSSGGSMAERPPARAMEEGGA